MPAWYRLNNSGSWTKIKKLYRLNNVGVWTQLKKLYRLSSAGLWQVIFSGSEIPAPTVFPKVRNSSGNDIDNVTYIARIGDTLTGYRGEWSDDPTSYDQRWVFSYPSSGGPYNTYSPSETNLTYTTKLTDDKSYLAFQVRATNSEGTSSYFTSTNEAYVVKYKPVSLAKPTFDTTAAEVGLTITAQGTGNSYWQRTTNITDDTSPNSYTYSWTYYPSGGTPGATNTNSTYTPVLADVDKQLQVTITATNSGGSTSRTSDPTVKVGQEPTPDVNPSIARVGYTGNGASTITTGFTLRGNTGQWTPDLTNAYWGFQIGNGTTSEYTLTNGTDTSENQNHDYVVPTTYLNTFTNQNVTTIGKYIRFYTIPEVNGAQSNTFNTEWIGPIYRLPTSPSSLSITYSSPSSQTQVNVSATWTDATSYYEYTVQYYNPSTLAWVNLHSQTTTGTVASTFLAPVGTFNYRVRNDNGDGIYAYSAEVSVTLTAPYQFSFGNRLYPSTNGWIGIDSGHATTAIPTTGRFFAVFPTDFVYSEMHQWSGGGGTVAADDVKYVLKYTGYRYNQTQNDSNRITWMAIFYTDTQYADFKIIYKGSNVSGSVIVGFYNNGTLTSGLPGPYSIGTGTTFRIYYNNTGTNSFSLTSFDEILNTSPNNVMLSLGSPTNGLADDGFWNILTADSKFTTPTVTTGTTTNGTKSLSISYTEANSTDSIDYVIRSGSHSGTSLTSGNDTDTPLTYSSTTNLAGNTDYYVTLTPKNYKGQKGSDVQFTTKTAPIAPTVTFSNVTSSAFDVSWSSTGATYYYVDIYNTSTAVSLSGFPKTNTTTTSASPFGLSAGTQYTVAVSAGNTGGLGDSTISTKRTLYAARTPTFGTLTRGDGKISSSVTNYDTNWTFDGTSSTGNFAWGTASGATRPFEVTGLTDNQETTVTVTTTRPDYAGGSATQTGSALATGLTPTFGTNTAASGGFSGSVTNYDSNYTWSLSTNSGTVSPISFSGTGTTKTFSVSGLSSGGSATVTVTTSRPGYKGGSGTTTGTATSTVAPNGGTLNNLSLRAGSTGGRIGAIYDVSINTEASGTPSSMTKSYQWQHFNNQTSSWNNIDNATNSSYTIPWTYFVNGSERPMPGATLRCNVTWSNGVSPDQTVSSNSISISSPTITGITVDFSDLDPYVVYRCYGYNFRSIGSTLTYGSTTPPGTVGSTIYSSSTNTTIPITRQSGQGGTLFYYKLEVTPYSSVGTQVFPVAPYSAGTAVTTSTLRNTLANRNAGWINTYGTGDA